jgi:uridine phosphorylase
METAGLYGLSKLLGHHCLSLSAIVDNRVTKTFSRNASATVEQLVLKAMEVVAGLHTVE